MEVFRYLLVMSFYLRIPLHSILFKDHKVIFLNTHFCGLFPGFNLFNGSFPLPRRVLLSFPLYAVVNQGANLAWR